MGSRIESPTYEIGPMDPSQPELGRDLGLGWAPLELLGPNPLDIASVGPTIGETNSIY